MKRRKFYNTIFLPIWKRHQNSGSTIFDASTSASKLSENRAIHVDSNFYFFSHYTLKGYRISFLIKLPVPGISSLGWHFQCIRAVYQQSRTMTEAGLHYMLTCSYTTLQHLEI